MGDIGDYWREHKEEMRRRKNGRLVPTKVEYECSCGKKYYSIFNQSRIEDHMRTKGDKHTPVKGTFVTPVEEIEL